MNESVLNNVSSFLKNNYGLDTLDSLDVLGNNENLVFSVKDKVFRITNFTHRNEKEISEELKLLQLLFENGCSVVEVIKSINGNNFEVDFDSETYVTAFNNAKGKIIDIDDYDEKNQIISEWGRTMGEIHKTISLNRKKLNFDNRLEWDEEIIIAKANELVPDGDNLVISELNRIMERFGSLEKNGESYGYVHTDMRPRNFHYQEGKIIHFDFDDISSNWYIYDIAVAVFHEAEGLDTREERTKSMKNFIQFFVKGYLKEKSINNVDFQCFIDFMKMRLIYAYIDYYKRLKIKGVDSGKGKMLGRRKFIENFEDFVDVSEIEKTLYSLK